VTIQDNCGGIDLEYARTEAFNFGHSEGHTPENLGVYGVGLKRAVFKIGRRFTIESKTMQGGFVCSVDVDDWLAKDGLLEDWRFPLKETGPAPFASAAGTKIEITNLNDEVVHRINDPTFASELCRRIGRTFVFFLNQHVRIRVGGSDIPPFDIPIGKPKQGSATYERIDERGVTVRLFVTLARPNAAGRYEPDAAGWYVVCNGRCVLTADKSDTSGWGVTAMPPFHPQYNPFLGFVFFDSEDPYKLPWTTTKHSLNRESTIYQLVKGRMTTSAQPVLAFIRRKYKLDSDGISAEAEASKDVASATFKDLSVRQSVFRASVVKAKPKTTVKIQYDAEITDVDKIRKHLGRSALAAWAIGKHTFDYFMKQEGLK